jgi:hypothetical protein
MQRDVWSNNGFLGWDPESGQFLGGSFLVGRS